MKSKFITGVLISTFLLLPHGIKAANFTDNQTVDSNKTWTIKFTDEVGFDNATKEGITVTNTKGTKISAGIQLGQDNKTIIVTSPEGGYTKGENYILNIGNKAHSNKGKSLKNEYKLHFNIKKEDNNIITFKDTNLEQEIRTLINKSTGNIYKSDVENIKELTIELGGIQDISGIENLSNLQKLDLYGNKISDLTSLQSLTNLQELNLGYNKINDITLLKSLTNLTKLSLCVNQISDITALEDLADLQRLDLEDNLLSDINVLKGLSNLKILDLDYNKISDISPLKELYNLQNISAYKNQISDIGALKGLYNLKTLDLTDNKISDVTVLKGLSNLKTLYLGDNQISDADKQLLQNALTSCTIKYIRDYK